MGADSDVFSTNAVILSQLLPASFLPAYAVPLLVASLIVTFAGAFLTLDRTRSFPPVDLPALKNQHSMWRLEGGIGGLLGGWLCGLHLTTYLALLVLNRSSLKLSSTEFLVIWVLSSVLLGAIGGRWRIAACVAFAIVGGASFTALLDIIFFPHSLLPRLIIYAIFTPLLMVGTLLPMPAVRHSSLRACTALTGSAGFVIAISLFKNIESWSNPWLTLAIPQYVGAIDVTEKGLSATVCIMALAGVATDWLLRRRFGEDPDKEWDDYLARYSRQLPLSSDRAGVFTPFQSFWSRLFHGDLRRHSHDQLRNHDPDSKEMVFPSDSDLLPAPVTLQKQKNFVGTPPPAFRPYTSRKKSLLTKKVHMLSDDSSSDSDSDSENENGAPGFKPWLMKRTNTGNSAATTVVNELGSLAPPPKLGKSVEEYSDVEEDLMTLAASSVDKDKERESPGWKPAFMKKHEEELKRSASGKTLKGKEKEVANQDGSPITPTPASGGGRGGSGSRSSAGKLSAPPRLTDSPTPLSRQTTQLTLSQPPKADLAIPPGSVPATPSLIKAYNRISKAQQEAAASLPNTPARKHSSLDLDEGFWNNVRAKAVGFRPVHR